MASSISCPVCENLCSTEAAACPKCGHPINPTPPVVSVEKEEPKPEQADAGSVLRGVLWVLFVISLLYALGAIGIYRDMPYSVRGIFGTWSNDAQINEAYFAIGYHVAPLIIMVIVLALAYSAKGRR